MMTCPVSVLIDPVFTAAWVISIGFMSVDGVCMNCIVVVSRFCCRRKGAWILSKLSSKFQPVRYVPCDPPIVARVPNLAGYVDMLLRPLRRCLPTSLSIFTASNGELCRRHRLERL